MMSLGPEASHLWRRHLRQPQCSQFKRKNLTPRMQDDGGEQTCETSPDRSDKMVKVTSGFVGIPQQMLDNSRQECWSVKGTLFYFHQLLDLAPVIGRIMVASGAHVPDSLHGKEI